MVDRLYLGDALGWGSDSTSKVAISQLREKNIIIKRCAKAQVIQSSGPRLLATTVKILGYIPILNIIVGALAIHYASNSNRQRPHNKEFWILRGVSMILFGPLLIPIDFIKTLCDERIASKYTKKHPELIAQFNCPHNHSTPSITGQPVWCIKSKENRP